MPAFAETGVHVPTFVQADTTTVLQVVAVYALPEFAAAAVQLATAVGPVGMV